MGVSGALADAVGGTPEVAPRRQIQPLTGVRGLAALWVAGCHLVAEPGLATGLAARILARGYLAVDLFFILSGFVMALNYGHLFRRRVRAAVFGRFLILRLARLYPLYGSILLLRFAYTALRYGSFDLPRPWIAAPLPHPAIDLPANVLLVQSWGIAKSSIGPAWSVSTEWGAYMVFPALAMLGLWRGRRAALATAMAAAVLLSTTALLDTAPAYHAGLLDAYDGRTLGPLMRCLGGFTVGVLTWRLSHWAPIIRLCGLSPPCVLIAALLIGGVATGAADFAVFLLFPAMVLCLACGTNRVTRLLASAPVVWLGEISYSIYLLHIFLLHPTHVTSAAAHRLLPGHAAEALSLAVTFGMLLIAADLSWRCIEQPGRRLIRRVAPR